MNMMHLFNFRLRNDVKLLSESLLFDNEFYASQLQGGESASITHFLTRGWKRGLTSSRFFDVHFYISQNTDVKAANVNPVIHYLRCGWREKRSPHPAFNVNEYISLHLDTDFDTVNPLEHCILNYGTLEWKNLLRKPASPVARNSGCISAFVDNHKEIRDVIAAEFDTEFYRAQGELPLTLDPIDHFIAFGWRQGRDPNCNFSVRDYLSLNPDVRRQNLNPFFHFIKFGRTEGRPPRIVAQRKLSVSKSLAPILFVGHDGIKAGAEVVLLEIVRWFAEHTRRPLKVLLMADGILASSYASYAKVYVLQDADDLQTSLESPELAAFMDEPFLVAYVNSVASGDFAVIYDRFLNPRHTPLILHVHELSNVIHEFDDKFRQIQSRATSMIAVSQRVKNCLMDDFGCDEDSIFLSNAFIRPIATSLHEIAASRQKARDALGIGEDDFVVMGCGTVCSRKGPDLFLDVATKILSRGTITRAKFLWIGDGPDIENCRAHAHVPALGGRVRFVGFRSDANMLLAAADVFFLSSREDPFPLVCLEAAQFAVPTMYFDGASGISEFTGTDAGIGIPAYDTDKCCTVLRSLARHPSALVELGATARSRVFASYSVNLRCREIAQYIQDITNSRPDVTVIVPAYNHADYIEERLESILNQTIQDFEVILLDDCSDDSTAEIADRFTSDSRVRVVRNDANSGSPFKQWKRGLELAKSPLVWIAEGDDSASDNFLETLLPALDDEQISLAFCSTEIMDCYSSLKPGALEPYYEQGSFPFHNKELVVDGFTAVELGFGAMCLIVNGSSALMRKSLVMGIIDEAASYKMCGDWLIYLYALCKGKLYYSSEAKNYFRRHSSSAVHRLEGTQIYFAERHRIFSFVVNNFNISRGLFQRALALNENEWHRFLYKNIGQQKAAHLRTDALIAARKKRWAISPMRIGFYVHGMLFSKGGIERLAAELANSLSRRGHSVTIFCRVWGTSNPVYRLNETVVVRPIFDENNIDPSVFRMRMDVARQDLDCFVPMLSEWLFEPVIEAVYGLGVPILASEHNDPWKIEQLWWPKDKRLACFNRTSAIHLLLDTFRASLPDHLTPRVTVIPNGIRIDSEILSIPVSNRPKRFIGVGRLAPQKRFDRLIKAFARISHQIPEWRLDIFGEGGEAGKLQKLIDENVLNERVALRGQSAMILNEFVNSSVFVLPSLFEGFPIVLLEAKTAGLPTIAYANCTGANELVRDNVDGLLPLQDEEGENLAAAMLALATDEDRRVRMASRARENIEDFDIEKIVDQWEEMLAQVVRVHDAVDTGKLVHLNQLPGTPSQWHQKQGAVTLSQESA